MKLDDVQHDETYTDEKGRVWKIVAWDVVDTDMAAPVHTFLATWRNRDGYKNVGLFVRSTATGNVWMTSIDGPMSTSKMRDAWRVEHDKEYQ